MTPSTNQHGSDTNHTTSIERFLKSDMDIQPLLNGIKDEQTARKWLGEANRIDVDTSTKELIVERIQELQ